MYDVHFRLIGKRVVDFLSVLIELLCQVLPLRRYERISFQNRRFRSNAVSLIQNFRQKGLTPHPPTILLLRKTRLNDLSYGIKIWTDLYFFLSQCTRLTDGRTDSQTAFSLIDRPAPCIQFSAVKIRGDFPVAPQFAAISRCACFKNVQSILFHRNLISIVVLHARASRMAQSSCC